MSDLPQALLAAVPVDGSSIGNQLLLEGEIKSRFSTNLAPGKEVLRAAG